MSQPILFIQQSAPHGAMTGQEGLDACLMGSAFSDCVLLFLGDGIYQVMSGQKTSALGRKDYSVSYRALADYGVERIYCRKDDLDARHLSTTDLCIEVKPIDDAAIASLLAEAKQVLAF